MDLLNSQIEHENIYVKHNKDIGYVSIIAVHNTKNGPALGGCRYVNYSEIL